MTSKEVLERLLKYAHINEAELITKYGYSALSDIEIIKQDLDRLEKLEKIIEILKRICLFEFEEESLYQQDECDDCYVIYVTQFNNGFSKEEYDLLKEVLKE